MKKRLLAGMMAGLMILSQSTASFGFEKYDKSKMPHKPSGTFHAAGVSDQNVFHAAGDPDGKTKANAIIFTGNSVKVSFSDYPFWIYKYTPQKTGDYEIKSSNPENEADPKILLLDNSGKITRIMDEAYTASAEEDSLNGLNFDLIVPCTAGQTIYFAVTTYAYFGEDCDYEYRGKNIDDIFGSIGVDISEWECDESYTVTISSSSGHTHGVDYNGTKTTVQAENCGRIGKYTYVCGICGRTVTETVPATGAHSWDSGKVTTAATELGKGVRTYTCSVCGSKRTASIPATGIHSFGGWTVTKAASEEAEGTETRTCSGCGFSETRALSRIVIPVTVSKAPASVKAKAKKNKVTVSWKKIRKKKKTKALLAQINSIQVQYSTDPNFVQNKVSMTVGKKKAKVVLKLQNKTEYYVRVRYVGVDGVSAWSGVKRVKTK